MQILMHVAARGWPTMMAGIGVLRALHRNEERVHGPQGDALGQAEAEAG
jgi:hypothetical protein